MIARTAIAVMAFGFLIERFDLFIRYAAPRLAEGVEAAQGRNVADIAGIAFVLMGMAMIVIAAARFFRTARQIDAEDLAGPLLFLCSRASNFHTGHIVYADGGYTAG